MRFRVLEHVVRISACAFALVASPSWAGPIAIFSDGFESRNTLAWSAEQPPLETPTVHRLTDLDLRDPHGYVQLIACLDITNNDVPGVPGTSINGRLATAVSSDGDGDGFLDSSSLLAFRPYDSLATAERIDLGSGNCPEPSPPASCDWRMPPVPRTSDYDAFDVGACLEPAPGTTTVYSPAITPPVGSCVVSSPTTLYLALLGAEIPVLAAQVAAERLGEPPTELRDGLWMGFLRESDADAILLPPAIPIVGGQPISILFPGGTGNCAAHDDRDAGPGGESGWWLYFNFTAAPVSFTGR